MSELKRITFMIDKEVHDQLRSLYPRGYSRILRALARKHVNRRLSQLTKELDIEQSQDLDGALGQADGEES